MVIHHAASQRPPHPSAGGTATGGGGEAISEGEEREAEGMWRRQEGEESRRDESKTDGRDINKHKYESSICGNVGKLEFIMNKYLILQPQNSIYNSSLRFNLY